MSLFIVLTVCRILRVCHGVLYKQLSAWMLHGLLTDERGEFFIETVEEPSAEVKQEQVYVDRICEWVIT